MALHRPSTSPRFLLPTPTSAHHARGRHGWNRTGPVTALALVALLVPASGHSQETESPLSPAGRLRVQVAPTFVSWDSRYGLRAGEGGTVEESEPLGFDLDRRDASALFPGVSDLETRVRGILGDQEFFGLLGATRVHVGADRVTVPIRMDLGVHDRVTVGAMVPFVKNRTHVVVHYDSTGANLGINPAVSDPALVESYLTGLNEAEMEARAQAMEVCSAQPSSPGCADLTNLADDLLAFRGELASAYGASFLFPTDPSAAGTGLRDSSDALQQRLTSMGLPGLEAELPLAGPVGGREGFDRLIERTLGTAPLADRGGLWELGDVEVHALVRLLDGARRDTAGGPALARWQVGAGALVRLGTGSMDDPDVLLDLPSGDGQTDLEGRMFADLRWGRLGLWSDARYGVQLSREIVRRVGPPDVALLARSNRTLLEWKPGSYIQLEVAPRLHLTDELAVAGAYRLWSKAEDEWARVSDPLDPPADPWVPAGTVYTDASLLGLESEETRQELGAALSYATLNSWREGRAPVPMEGRLSVRWSVAGSGGRTPETFTTAVALRIYHRLWGG